jgi:hypothetical protein
MPPFAPRPGWKEIKSVPRSFRDGSSIRRRADPGAVPGDTPLPLTTGAPYRSRARKPRLVPPRRGADGVCSVYIALALSPVWSVTVSPVRPGRLRIVRRVRCWPFSRTGRWIAMPARLQSPAMGGLALAFRILRLAVAPGAAGIPLRLDPGLGLPIPGRYAAMTCPGGDAGGVLIGSAGLQDDIDPYAAANGSHGAGAGSGIRSPYAAGRETFDPPGCSAVPGNTADADTLEVTAAGERAMSLSAGRSCPDAGCCPEGNLEELYGPGTGFTAGLVSCRGSGREPTGGSRDPSMRPSGRPLCGGRLMPTAGNGVPQPKGGRLAPARVPGRQIRLVEPGAPCRVGTLAGPCPAKGAGRRTGCKVCISSCH